MKLHNCIACKHCKYDDRPSMTHSVYKFECNKKHIIFNHPLFHGLLCQFYKEIKENEY